jgi:Zn-dependent peptidase ImmA (M78 family)/transcriptional regulator with XRE-family HTH domain
MLAGLDSKMRLGTPGFVPARLTEARAARRIPTMTALARRIGVNPATVSRWEDGSSLPEHDALLLLADTLSVRPEFFLRPAFESDRPYFARSLSSTLVRDVEFQKSQMKWLHEICAVVEQYVDLPPVDIPEVLGGASYRQLREDDIEQIALDLRQHWRLGDGPCLDVVGLMEKVGVVVASIEIGTSKLDGLCGWAEDGRPHVILSNDKMSFARRQMDAGHELAHAILHKNVSFEEFKNDLKFIEQQAFRLASAMLMPSTSFPLETRTYSLNAFLGLKERWKVSVKAQIKRLQDLDILDSDQATQLYKLYSAKGWSRQEPLDDRWPLQEPRMLAEAFTLIVESGVRSKSELAEIELAIPAGDIEALANLPAGWLTAKSGDVLPLRLKTVPSELTQGESGNILPFRYQ